MADKSDQIIIEGLTRAVALPQGGALLSTRNTTGFFTANAAGKKLAQQCKEQGLLQVVRTETKGKNTFEICTITEKGIAHLLAQSSPREILREFVGAVEARGREVQNLVETARECQQTFAALKVQVETVLAQVQQPIPLRAPTLNGQHSHSGSNGTATAPEEPIAPPTPSDAITETLEQWHQTRGGADCPLPELYRQARASLADLSLGQFHDALRALHHAGQVYLHPWTGPLYEIPQPACALLVGHSVVYYVSRKES